MKHRAANHPQRSRARRDPIARCEDRKTRRRFLFTEGPVWVPRRSDGYLLFSDPNNNLIYRWTQDGRLSIYHDQKRLSRNRHRRIRPARIERTDTRQAGTPDHQPAWQSPRRSHGEERSAHRVGRRYEGKRLNSPNDLVYKSDGALYFTDPPFGLPKFFDDPRKELPYSGVFRVSADGTQVRLVTTDLKGPNGLAFSPDEKYLYVDNWDDKRKDHHAIRSRCPMARSANGTSLLRHDFSRAAKMRWTA